MPQSPQVVGEITHSGPQKHLTTYPPESPQVRPSPTPFRRWPRALGPSQAWVLWPPPRYRQTGVSPRAWENRGKWRVHHQIRSGVACSSQMPLSLPVELELNHRSALLEPCAASAAAAAAAAAALLSPPPPEEAPRAGGVGRRGVGRRSHGGQLDRVPVPGPRSIPSPTAGSAEQLAAPPEFCCGAP